MKMRILLGLLLAFGLLSCQGDKVKTLKKSNNTEIKKKEQKKSAPLNKENAVKFLTKYGEENPETELYIVTNYGRMRVKLYKDTPLHRANFIYLAKNKYWNDTFFHRVVKGFMIQGGNTDNWGTSEKRAKVGIYNIPAEINENNFHKKGALSASRSYTDNPDKESVPFEFFIVRGHTFVKEQIEMLEEQYQKKIGPNQRKEYYKIGGTPHLDGEHTVFGEVTEGFDVLDKINEVETDKGEWPMVNVVMKVEIIK